MIYASDSSRPENSATSKPQPRLIGRLSVLSARATDGRGKAQVRRGLLVLEHELLEQR